VGAILLCAAARPAARSSAASAVVAADRAGPALPATLLGRPGRALERDASEALLAMVPGVRLERRAYGETAAALVTARGLRENHPPAVCLKAGGFELVERTEEHGQGHCVVHLEVRKGGTRSHHFYTYLAHGADGAVSAGSCDFWRQVASAAWRRLTGRPGAWSTLQVMDRDAGQARAALHELIRRNR